MVHAADAVASTRCRRPLEEGDDGARLAGRVAEVQVVGARIVEVDRLLHEPEPEHVVVERQRAAGVRGDEGDVVEPEGGKALHNYLCWLIAHN